MIADRKVTYSAEILARQAKGLRLLPQNGSTRSFLCAILYFCFARWVLWAFLMNPLGAAEPFPEIKLKGLDNRWYTWEKIAGDSLTVVDFWATWCKPCLRMIPHLNQISQDFAERGVKVVGINVDSPRNLNKVKPMANMLGIRYRVLLDARGEVMEGLQIRAIPTILIVNRARQILYWGEGYRPGDEARLKATLTRLLDQGASSE